MDSDSLLRLGRLAEKLEPAGKIRVFAITDSITQAVLKPLHDLLFSLLSTLKTDGLYDQGRPLQRLLELKREGVVNPSELFYSYDLSAATDRLPIKVQQQVLNHLFADPKVGNLWGQLLCDRDWWHDMLPLRYAVGQPMGALSS